MAGDGGWLGLRVELPVGRDMAERNPELVERERWEEGNMMSELFSFQEYNSRKEFRSSKTE